MSTNQQRLVEGRRKTCLACEHVRTCTAHLPREFFTNPDSVCPEDKFPAIPGPISGCCDAPGGPPRPVNPYGRRGRR